MTEDDAGHIISFLETISRKMDDLKKQAGSVEETLHSIQGILLDIQQKQ